MSEINVRHVATITDDEMIATFLGGEISSPRFGGRLAAVLETLQQQPSIVTQPDLTSQNENTLRRAIFSEYRGYGEHAGLFNGFPDDVVWERRKLTRDEILGTFYISWEYWLDLTNGSRRATDGASRIMARREPAFEGFIELSDAMAAGRAVPEMIFVTAGSNRPLVVLEGHARLTAYALRPEAMPAELAAIVGESSRMTEWALY